MRTNVMHLLVGALISLAQLAAQDPEPKCEDVCRAFVAVQFYDCDMEPADSVGDGSAVPLEPESIDDGTCLCYMSECETLEPTCWYSGKVSVLVATSYTLWSMGGTPVNLGWEENVQMDSGGLCGMFETVTLEIRGPGGEVAGYVVVMAGCLDCGEGNALCQ